MWIYSTLGHFSIVTKKAGEWEIRSRDRRDLVNLKEAALARVNPKIIASPPTNDYPFRIRIGDHGLMLVMMALGESITYPNFKGAIEREPGQRDRIETYHRIHATMALTEKTPRHLR